jgi:hypothetical protein
VGADHSRAGMASTYIERGLRISVPAKHRGGYYPANAISLD